MPKENPCMEQAMTTLDTGEPFTYDDLRSFPDDRYRRELIDGQLIVSPSPVNLHQLFVMELGFALRQVRPPGLIVLPGPVDVVFSQSTVLIPDLVVVPADAAGDPNLTKPPLLVVEVASPSTRRTDRTLKLATYEANRVPSYWLADPDGPSLTVMELDGERYGPPRTVTGDEAITVERPFPAQLTPGALVRPAGSA
jgi:Uma2 family endonuclease